MSLIVSMKSGFDFLSGGDCFFGGSIKMNDEFAELGIDLDWFTGTRPVDDGTSTISIQINANLAGSRPSISTHANLEIVDSRNSSIDDEASPFLKSG